MVNDLDAVLDALADPTRRHVVELLVAGPHRAGELADASGTPPPQMSRHLRVLLDNGLVSDERVAHDARVRIFRLRSEPFVALRAWLEHIELVGV